MILWIASEYVHQKRVQYPYTEKASGSVSAEPDIKIQLIVVALLKISRQNKGIITLNFL